jgi:hypothetical protein
VGLQLSGAQARRHRQLQAGALDYLVRHTNQQRHTANQNAIRGPTARSCKNSSPSAIAIVRAPFDSQAHRTRCATLQGKQPSAGQKPSSCTTPPPSAFASGCAWSHRQAHKRAAPHRRSQRYPWAYGHLPHKPISTGKLNHTCSIRQPGTPARSSVQLCTTPSASRQLFQRLRPITIPTCNGACSPRSPGTPVRSAALTTPNAIGEPTWFVPLAPRSPIRRTSLPLSTAPHTVTAASDVNALCRCRPSGTCTNAAARSLTSSIEAARVCIRPCANLVLSLPPLGRLVGDHSLTSGWRSASLDRAEARVLEARLRALLSDAFVAQHCFSSSRSGHTSPCSSAAAAYQRSPALGTAAPGLRSKAPDRPRDALRVHEAHHKGHPPERIRDPRPLRVSLHPLKACFRLRSGSAPTLKSCPPRATNTSAAFLEACARHSIPIKRERHSLGVSGLRGHALLCRALSAPAQRPLWVSWVRQSQSIIDDCFCPGT